MAETRALGDKLAARKRAVDAGVPVVPGIFWPIVLSNARDEAELREQADRIGYPVLIKAAAGGGGRGQGGSLTDEDGDGPAAQFRSFGAVPYLGRLLGVVRPVGGLVVEVGVGVEIGVVQVVDGVDATLLLEAALDDLQGKEVLALLTEHPAQALDVLLVELAVPRGGAFGVDETLALEEADLRDGDVGELLTQQGEDVADGEIGTTAHDSSAAAR